MKKGQIYMVELERPDEQTRIKLSNPCPVILVINMEGPKPTGTAPVIIPIEQIEGSIPLNGVEIIPNLLEDNSEEVFGIALADKIRTIDISLLKDKPIGSLNYEGLKLIDRAILDSMGIRLQLQDELT